MLRRTALALLLCGALLGASCSDDDDDAAGDAGGTEEAEETRGSKLPAGHPIQGITDTEIKIGVVHFPLNNNDMSTHWEALLKEAREDGRLPVHGRDIKPVYHLVDFGPESHRAACIRFADEEKVFLGVGVSNYLPTAECMTKERKLIFYGAAGLVPNDDLLAQTHPFLFVNNMSQSKVLRNWPHWAEDQDVLDGKKIGLVRADNPRSQAEIDRFFKPQLDELGYRLTEEVLFTDPSSVPGMVQRLKASGVETVFLDAGAAIIPFAQEMDKQGFHPTVLVTEHDTTSTTSSVPREAIPDSFKALGMSAYHRAEDGIQGNPSAPPEQKKCLDTYEKHYGIRFVEFSGGRPTADYANVHSITHVCDVMPILIDALEEAGPDLTPTALVRALESKVKGRSGEVLDITFGPDDHSGSEELKTIEWNTTCKCWGHVSDPREVYVR